MNNGWKEYCLEDLLSYEQPTPYIVESTEYSDAFETPVLTAGASFILGYTDEAEGIYDQIPVIIFDDFTTASKYVDFPFKVKSSAMKILTANKELVLPKFIYYRMQTIKFEHSTHKRYWIQQYSKIKVAVPSLSEQKRIVNKIEKLFSELDSAVVTLKKTKEQLAVYRQSVLKDAFDACDKKEKITSYFEISAGLTKNSKRASFPLKMPYLRVANVYYNRLNLSEIKSIGVQESEIGDKLLKKEDLLFVEGNGSKEQIGRVAIWDDSIKNCLHQNHIIKGRPLGGMLSKFALYYLISDFGRKQILKVSSSTSGLYTLSTEKVRNLNVPSCSLLKQKNIVQKIESRLSACENIEKTVNEALMQADAMRQSILKKAFEGGL